MPAHHIPLPPSDQAFIATALRLTRARWPDINPTGLHPYPLANQLYQMGQLNRAPAKTAPIQPDEITAAIAFLDECRPVSRGTITSYRLKHVIEDWCGRYISNGATLVAADALDFRIDAFPDGNPNALINISKIDLRRMAVSS